MGSVKDLEILKKPSEIAMGIGRFHFSDRYSVFDWGEMPDQIKAKGEALCLMGAYCFEQLEAKKIKTHYRGIVNKKGKVVSFEEIEFPTNNMEVNLVNVYHPKIIEKNSIIDYDYGQYNQKLKNCLIPLEVIYRNGLPKGSSVFKRIERGKTTLKDLGLDHYPIPGEHFSKPIFDVSTKLENKDRYITWEKAKKIAGLTDDELESIKSILLKVNTTITNLVSDIGLVNEDGKIELAFDDLRKLIIVDVVGTLDECRFMYNGFHISKEIARQFYKETQWYVDVENAKRDAEQKNITDWKSLCNTKPPKLNKTLLTIISNLYMATTNAITKQKFFDVDSLPKIIEYYNEYLVEKK